MRDGLLFTRGACCAKRPTGAAAVSADNVGWRDQRYFGTYERIGLFKISGLWDEIPQFYSVDTRTPFVESGEGVLVLDDNAQRAANLNAYLPISPQFDLRERRDIGTFRVSATPTTHLDVTGGFTTTKHSGELPWGASFGFSNDNEVALPYKSRTNDLDIGPAVDEHAGDDSRRIQRFVVQQPGRHADLGQPAGADGSTSRARPVMAGRPCGRPTRCRR